MQKVKIMFLGCGFLVTHIIPHVLPFSSHLILVDREKIEKNNYDNSIFPKNYVGKRKVTALASLVQVLSSVPVTPIHLNISKPEQLLEIHVKYKPDFVFVTFDNIKSRIIAKEYALNTVPALFVGVTENYVYIDWGKNVVLPKGPKEIEEVEKELERIRDVCTRLEFRGLGAVAAAYSYIAFSRWVENREKYAFMISIRENINSVLLKR